MIALTLTVEPSCTKRSLIFTVPVVLSIVSGTSDPNDHVSPFLAAVYVSSRGLSPCVVYVTLSRLTFVSFR